LLRHSDFEPATSDVELGSVNLEGATIGVLDEAALSEVDLGVDEVERTRRQDDGYGDQGVEVGTGADGDHAIFVNATKAATVIVIPF
jgi:hypothetical protein